MRRLIFILAFALVSTVSFGQMTFWNMTSTRGFKVATEYTQVTDQHLNYTYVEGLKGYGSNPSDSYMQLIREQTLFPNFSAHVEYRSNLTFDWNTAYVGVAYSFVYKNGYIAVEPLFRLDEWKHGGFQFSLVGEFKWKWIEFAFYNDAYITGQFNGNYTEVRGWLEIPKINRWVKPGIVFTNTASEGNLWEPQVFFGFKFNI